MCGYLHRRYAPSDFQQLLDTLGLEAISNTFQEHTSGDSAPSDEHFYPAFGGDASRQIHGLIIQEEEQIQTVDATWWFDCEADGETLVTGPRTTFNARNLGSPFWREALQARRGVVVATGLGESKMINGRRHRFLMEANTPFLLGALYRRFSNGRYACAVITRDSHPRFEPYHDKAFPLFLPPDPEFIRLWLDSSVGQAAEIDHLLAHPVLYPELAISEVKTFRHGQMSLDPIILRSDPDLARNSAR